MSGCGCEKSNCKSCSDTYVMQKDCCNPCNRCGCKDVQECGCNTGGCKCENGPTEVTNEELGHDCAWFWVSIYRNCCEQPVRVSPSRLRSFLIENVDFSEFVDLSFVQEQVSAQLSNYVTNEQFISLQNKVTKNCRDILAIQTFIANLSIPGEVDLSDYATISYVDTQITQLSEEIYANFYTREQVNNLFEGMQNQINALQAQLNECDCGGGTGGTFTAPTADFADILATDCPAEVSAQITIADAAQFAYESTGDGVITVLVNGTAVGTPFSANDGDNVTVRVNGNDGENVVGVVTLTYDDGNGNTGIVDGVQYDVTCPVIVTNNPPQTSPMCENMEYVIGDSVSITFDNLFVDSDGDTLTYTTAGILPDGLVASSSGISGTLNGPAGTFEYTITANDGNDGEVSCTFDFVIGEPPVQSAGGTGDCASDEMQPEPRVWCGSGSVPSNQTQVSVGGPITGETCGVGFTRFITTIDGNGETLIDLTVPLPANVTQLTVSGGINQSTVIDVSAFTGQTNISIPGINGTLQTILNGAFSVTGNC